MRFYKRILIMLAVFLLLVVLTVGFWRGSGVRASIEDASSSKEIILKDFIRNAIARQIGEAIKVKIEEAGVFMQENPRIENLMQFIGDRVVGEVFKGVFGVDVAGDFGFDSDRLKATQECVGLTRIGLLQCEKEKDFDSKLRCQLRVKNSCSLCFSKKYPLKLIPEQEQNSVNFDKYCDYLVEDDRTCKPGGPFGDKVKIAQDNNLNTCKDQLKNDTERCLNVLKDKTKNITLPLINLPRQQLREAMSQEEWRKYKQLEIAVDGFNKCIERTITRCELCSGEAAFGEGFVKIGACREQAGK